MALLQRPSTVLDEVAFLADALQNDRAAGSPPWQVLACRPVPIHSGAKWGPVSPGMPYDGERTLLAPEHAQGDSVAQRASSSAGNGRLR